ncbi:sulfite reductase : Sulfite reductase (NADPH) flavoprotein alpha-component OS=Rhodopirellula sp. SWK7 GN=RRSWK_01818 PE=4 SV=1: FeS: FAD_binding_1: NAD_binding_1 [Gemmataceae bacterium]|nr:sulfite reductase : Sulfite reductase (NADPH) flavoprotein alpha-component OS=Rhodopirellula sp. SWK7 GN=RRSWK_01818 PE=4 SV=1: FeS: FAD_binding_1: NAD_binding_1 [Gemmataceae bacterium]VTU00289.1 sulfite reductase : Sulfite reductase (NADPH) flavoprotein alpha-component OS=Rhodopirellula sp. SWK7 GN=RRSWK_01818 PE=4 SV=1: FeS: FAD_binding_1: NAD_binding_1 [Gemmataceae bacterium]
MAIPVLPESAPFSGPQRAWLNGFFAGLLGIDGSANGAAPNGHAPAASAAAPAEEDFPWHDPALKMDERLKLADGKPFERVLMAAMAQLDCGACGYVCKSYSEAIARGEDTDLSKCSPGGKETSKKLKELLATRKALPVVEANGHHGLNGTNGVAAKPSANGTNGTGAHAPGGYDRKNPFLAPLLECQKLTSGASQKDVRFVSFSLRGSGLTYEVGDALGLMPENDPELVEAVLKAMGARGDELVPTPTGPHVHAYDALAKHYVITKVSERLAALLADSATDPSESGTLKTLVQDDVEGVPAAWDVLDLLEQFPSARAPVADMVAALSPLQPRLYSISSSLKAHPDEVHLTVGVVRYTQGSRVRKGVASNFVTETLRTRQKAGVFVHHSPGFRVPTSGDVPVIMVGPGTGIAPFRAFLQERAATGATGKNWLFFGDQRRDTDFLYRYELEGYQNSGVLTRLDTAFSRDQAEKVYVQNRMLENAAELWDWLQNGAHFYVCGDARRMALDVDHALHAIVAQQGGLSPDDAKEYVRKLSKEKRYQRDVY